MSTSAQRLHCRTPGQTTVALPQREWYPTAKAAAMLGFSERTLRRRIQASHWIQGRHYRWVMLTSRAVLEVNVPRAIDLLNRWGWR